MAKRDKYKYQEDFFPLWMVNVKNWQIYTLPKQAGETKVQSIVFKWNIAFRGIHEQHVGR